MSLKLNSSGGGSVTVQEPTTASNRTLNLPDADGTVVLTGVSGNVDINAAGANNLTLSTNTTERARIDSSGNLLVGTTSAVSLGAGTHILSLKGSGAATTWGVGPTSSFGNFYVKSGTSTGVVLTSSATSWASDSDERKKTALVPFSNPIEKVLSLRAGTGRYITDDYDVSRSFLIAQDVQKVLPEAVDANDDEQGSLILRYTDVIPLLVAAIKEQQQMIETLQAKVAALEAK